AVGFVLFAAVAARLPLGDAADAVLAAAWLTLAAVGLVLAGVDIQVYRLPRSIIVVTTAVIIAQVTAAALVRHHPGLLGHAALAALVFTLAYLVLALLGPGLVGAGDIYLAALLGLLLGTGPLRQILAGATLPYLLGASVV